MRWLLVVLLAVSSFAQESPVEQAIAALEQDDFAAAVPLLETAAEAEPDNASIQFNLGFALAQLQRDDEAIAAYRRALAIEPELRPVFLNLGVVLLRNGRAAEAAPLLSRAAANRPDDPQVQYFHAHALAATGQASKAIPIYERAAELDPEEPSIWIELGQAQAALDQIEAASESYRKAGELDPQLRSYQLQLAEQVENGGGLEQALEMYRAFLDVEPANVAVRERVGILLLELERYMDAAKELQTVVDQGPTDAARAALAQAYVLADDADTARQRLAEAVAANPNEPELRLRYGASLIQALDYERAHGEYLAAVQQAPDSAKAWTGLAFTLHQLKNYEGCLQALANAEKQEPLKPASIYLRAITEDRLQLYKEAQASYQAFLAAAPGLEDEEWKSRQRLRAIELVLSKR
jgi:tetratricopeptide (TPR) repeat protein